MESAVPGAGKTTILSGYDDYDHLRACSRAFPDRSHCRPLLDQLAVFGVTYVTGASSDYGLPSAYRSPQDVDLGQLVVGLARAPSARVRDALVSLLLRHPESASTVKNVIKSPETTGNTRASLTARLLAAAALQRSHEAAFKALEHRYVRIDVSDLTTAEGLPSADDGEGRLLLKALQDLVTSRHPAIDVVSGWDSVARHTLQEIAWARVDE